MNCFRLATTESELGWLGLLIDNNKISRVKFGFATEIKLIKSFEEYFDVVEPNATEKRWLNQLKKFTAGKSIELDKLAVDYSHYTDFQTKVLKRCRKIPYGRTISYGELAAKVSAPRAARAVGSAMKKNRFPLIIPCHRVVSSSGIGGYSAADGISVKHRLLALEGVQFADSGTNKKR